MSKITEATEEQWAAVEQLRDKWIDNTTNQYSLEDVTEVVNRMYVSLGLKPPIVLLAPNPLMMVYWSVLCGQLFEEFADKDSEVTKAFVSLCTDKSFGKPRSSVLNSQPTQFRDLLFIRLNDQLRDQIHKQLSEQLNTQLQDQLEVNLGNQLSDQLDSQFDNQLSGQLSEQLYEQLGKQLYAQLRDQINEKLYEQLFEQLYDQLSDQLCTKLLTSLVTSFMTSSMTSLVTSSMASC